MKTDPRLWLSPPLKRKSVPDEIPNSAHLCLNDGLSWLLFLKLLKIGSPGRNDLLWNQSILKNNPSDCEVDVNHKKWLRLFLNLIKNFTRYSTACCCTPYCEVELLRRVAHMFGPASHLFDYVPEKCWIFDLVNIPLNYALNYWLRVTKILIFSLKWLTVFLLNGTASTPFFPIRFRVSSKGKPPIPSAFS